MTFREARVMTVVALGSDSTTVVVSDGFETGLTVPCLVAYNPRLVGDQVLVTRLEGGGWLVHDAIGAARSPVSYGVGVPTGGGWRRSTTAYVKDNPDGSSSIYLDTTGSVPMPATIAATTAAGFLSFSTARVATPRAGAESATQADWYGAWYYGGAIQAAASAGTVGTMRVKITRTNTGTGSRPLTLGLHSQDDEVQPNITDQWNPGVSLMPGGSTSVLIPVTQAGRLASGVAKGVAVWGEGVGQFATFSPAADITITFA